MKKCLAIIIIVSVSISMLAGCCNHEWVEADCVSPETCLNCGETRGEPMGHDFQNGYCTICGEKDPSINFDNMGFCNNYGMNEYVEILAYNDYMVKINTFADVYRLFDSYSYRLHIDDEYINVQTEGQSTDSLKWYTETYAGIKSNDLYILDYNSELRIYERAILDSGSVVLKCYDGSEERWFIPVDMLDWSTCELSTDPDDEEDSETADVEYYFIDIK